MATSTSQEESIFDFKPIIPRFLPLDEDEVESRSRRDGPPIFSKSPLSRTAKYNGEFTHVTIAKNWLICILSAPPKLTLMRFFLPRAMPPIEIELEKYLSGYKIHKLFVDYTGYHLLISLVPKSQGLSADFLYIHGGVQKVRRIEKFKDHEITAVAFNVYAGTESSTSSILLGTSRGLIFETELSQDVDRPSYRKQVYDFGSGRPKYPITGLELLIVPNSYKYIVIASTTDCVYTFHEVKSEEKSLQAIFTAYVSGNRKLDTLTTKTEANFSMLSFYAPPNAKFPDQWGWVNGTGLQVGTFNTDDSGTTAAATTTTSTLLQVDTVINMEHKKHLSYDERLQNMPKAFVLTAYHALLLYHDHLAAICLPSQEVVYEDYFPENNKILNIMRDPFTGFVYLHTEKKIFKLVIDNEHRDIWEIYLKKKLYEKAEIHAAENPEHLNIVLTAKAEAAYEQKDYVSSANIYAHTEEPFEKVCLMFLELEDKRPLVNYIRKNLIDVQDDAERVKVLVLWLVDLYLIEINMPDRGADERQQWQSEFNELMQQPVVAKCARVEREAIQELLHVHADKHNQMLFAIANEDYEEVINLLLDLENYNEALQTLLKQKDYELYYRYCPLIMEFLPHDVIEVLMMQGRKLQIPKLIPTLVTIEGPKHVEEVMRYLEFAIYKLGETNESVHNYLVQLYAKHKPEKVIGYLENEGSDRSLVHYDIVYVMDICLQEHLNVACVFMQCMMELWSVAVDLALTFDMALAKETASRPPDEEERREMWLRIARHEITGTDDVGKALDLLKECDLLRIEDLLPFFSDFEKIDDFKKPICEALKEYNQKIFELEQDMNEYDKQAERVRNDLQNVRERSVRVGAHETCSICELYLLVRPFFVFNCGHKFHNDCLEKQIIPTLDSERSRKLTMLKQQFDTLITQAILGKDDSCDRQCKRNKIKREIEEILAADCSLCGLLIDTIDKPFVENWDPVNVDWE